MKSDAITTKSHNGTFHICLHNYETASRIHGAIAHSPSTQFSVQQYAKTRRKKANSQRNSHTFQSIIGGSVFSHCRHWRVWSDHSHAHLPFYLLAHVHALKRKRVWVRARARVRICSRWNDTTDKFSHHLWQVEYHVCWTAAKIFILNDIYCIGTLPVAPRTNAYECASKNADNQTISASLAQSECLPGCTVYSGRDCAWPVHQRYRSTGG